MLGQCVTKVLKPSQRIFQAVLDGLVLLVQIEHFMTSFTASVLQHGTLHGRGLQWSG